MFHLTGKGNQKLIIMLADQQNSFECFSTTQVKIFLTQRMIP